MSSFDYDKADLQDHTFTAFIMNEDLLQCMLNFPEIEMHEPFLLDYGYIAAAQQHDTNLSSKLDDDPNHYNYFTVALQLCVIAHINKPGDNPKICIPDALLDKFIQFYHLALAHAGITRVTRMVLQYFWHQDLRRRTEKLIQSCEVCQKNKLPGKGYGQLPSRQAQLTPWQEVAVDLIGPWEMEMHGYTLSFRALTIIDTVTNFCEVVQITSKKADYIGQIFENTWLARYPRPIHCIFDQGTEFTGIGFMRMLHKHGIHPHPTTVKNPQANAICERLHQTIANSLAAFKSS